MQLSFEPPVANAILACSAGAVQLRDARYTASLIVTRDARIERWRHPALEQMTIEDFAPLLPLAPDIVLLGTGASQRLPPPALIAAFAARGIGLEAMDNAAACRTYNLLLSEFRAVAVALML
ncbi:MAG: Mth938-like domain-containing protein [Gammaproteobacteria bacterium]